MKKLVLSFLMVVVLVSGIFCQTFTTASGSTKVVAATPVISITDLEGVDYTIIVMKADVDDGSGDIEYVEVDGTVYILNR